MTAVKLNQMLEVAASRWKQPNSQISADEFIRLMPGFDRYSSTRKNLLVKSLFDVLSMTKFINGHMLCHKNSVIIEVDNRKIICTLNDNDIQVDIESHTFYITINGWLAGHNMSAISNIGVVDMMRLG